MQFVSSSEMVPAYEIFQKDKKINLILKICKIDNAFQSAFC